MRDLPGGIHAVAREAAAELVVDAAAGHVAQRRDRHVERALVAERGAAAQQQLDRVGMRELRRAREPAVLRVVRLGELRGGRVERRARRARGRGALRLHAPERLCEALALLADLARVLVVEAPDPLQEVGEARHAVARLAREVRAAEEGELVGGEEHRERPAAAPLREHRLRRLVDLVDVGALLAVHLHVHVEVVHHAGDRRVLERLVRHHVAPVARRISHREEDRLAGALRLRQGLLPPRVPIDGVVGVLAQVGAGLLGEAVGHDGQRGAGSGAGRNPVSGPRPAGYDTPDLSAFIGSRGSACIGVPALVRRAAALTPRRCRARGGPGS